MSDININVTNSNNDAVKPKAVTRKLTAEETKELAPMFYDKFMHGETKQHIAEEYNIPYHTLCKIFEGYVSSLSEEKQKQYEFRNNRGRYYAMFIDNDEWNSILNEEQVQEEPEDSEIDEIEDDRKKDHKNHSGNHFKPIIGAKVYSGGNKNLCSSSLYSEKEEDIKEFCSNAMASCAFSIIDNKISLIIYEVKNHKEVPVRKITLKSKRL